MSNHPPRIDAQFLAFALAGIIATMLAPVVINLELTSEGFGLFIGLLIAGLYWFVGDKYGDNPLIIMLFVGLCAVFISSCGLLLEEFEPKPNHTPYWILCGCSEGLLIGLPPLIAIAVRLGKRPPLTGVAKFFTFFVLALLILLTAIRLCALF